MINVGGFRSDPKPQKREKKKRKYIKQRTAKREALDKQYSQLARAFVRGKFCAVYPHLIATQVHHKMGRQGFADEQEIPLIVDVRFFLAVSAQGHDFIERNPWKARQQGWTVNRIK